MKKRKNTIDASKLQEEDLRSLTNATGSIEGFNAAFNKFVEEKFRGGNRNKKSL